MSCSIHANRLLTMNSVEHLSFAYLLQCHLRHSMCAVPCHHLVLVSSVLQVARYTALFSGVVYGWYHRRTIQANYDAQKLKHAAHDREHLIAEAKTAWKRRHETAKDDGKFWSLHQVQFVLTHLLQSSPIQRTRGSTLKNYCSNGRKHNIQQIETIHSFCTATPAFSTLYKQHRWPHS